MDIQTAYEILDLPQSVSLDELRSRYRLLARRCHPDSSPTGDSRRFLLLSTAYQLILDRLTNAEATRPTVVADDVIAASDIQNRISERFRGLREEYTAYRDRAVLSTRDYIHNAISSASSGHDLKRTIETRIKAAWTDLVQDIENNVSGLVHSATTSDQDFLYNLFADLYTAKRRYWLQTLYRDPLILTAAAMTVGSALLSPRAILVPLSIIGLYVWGRLWMLKPERQFVPPRLSTLGVETQVKSVARGVGQDF